MNLLFFFFSFLKNNIRNKFLPSLGNLQVQKNSPVLPFWGHEIRGFFLIIKQLFYASFAASYFPLPKCFHLFSRLLFRPGEIVIY